VFPGFSNDGASEVKNETITGLELGYGFRSSVINANVNLYSTSWSDRFLERGWQLPSGESGTAQVNNIAEVHNGIELEVFGEIARGLQLDFMFSAGDWEYKEDVEASVLDDDQQEVGTATLYLKDVKVGDAAQLTTRIGLTYEIVQGLRIYASYYYADNLYAQFNVGGFDDPTVPPEDRVLKLPDYNLVDLGLYYAFKVGSTDWMFKLNVNNVTDTKYWSESLTNITEPERFNENRPGTRD
jgi:outer membrane receptor protein involved in Fe transport